MVSKCGKLFVGGLSRETKEETLKVHFNKYGNVKECEVIKDRLTGHVRGFGFITFADPSVAETALQDHHIILGKTVEVKLARPKGINNACNGSYNCNSPQFTRKIFVGGLPPTLTETEFKGYFEGFGSVVDVVLMHDKENNNRPRGFGFITFDSEEAVEIVLQRNFHELNNKVVEVKRAEPRDKMIHSHICIYDTYNTGLGFGGGFPYAPYWYEAVHGYVYCGVGTPARAYNGVGYETFSGFPGYYQSPRSYRGPLFHPTYFSSGASSNGWGNRLRKDSVGYYCGTVLNGSSYARDDCGDAKVRIDDASSSNQKGVDGHSMSSCNSNLNDDGGDAEVPTLTTVHLIDDSLSLRREAEENLEGDDGQSLPCNSN